MASYHRRSGVDHAVLPANYPAASAK